MMERCFPGLRALPVRWRDGRAFLSAMVVLAMLAFASPAPAQFTDQRTWAGTAGGSANAITITVANYTSHLAGVPLRFKANASNTGATTIAVTGLSPLAIQKSTTSGVAALVGGEIVSGQIYTISYDGSVYQIISGLPTGNARVVKTTTYAALPSDCSKTLALGGAAFYVLTLNAAAGYPAECNIEVINTDTVRGKTVAANGLTALRLFGSQSVTYKIISGAWKQLPQYISASNTPTLYVNALNGSNDPLVSDCLATGGGACATFQAAANILQAAHIGGTIQADCDSAYNQTLNLIGYFSMPLVGVVGNPGSPSTCQITRNVADTIFTAQDHATLTVSGFSVGFAGTAGTSFVTRQFAIMDVNNIQTGSHTSGSVFIASEISKINVAGSLILAGNGNNFVNAADGATITFGPTVTGSAVYSFWFIASSGGLANGTPVWSISSVTGTQFACGLNGVVNLGAAYPAGMSAGSPSTGCQHNP